MDIFNIEILQMCDYAIATRINIANVRLRYSNTYKICLSVWLNNTPNELLYPFGESFNGLIFPCLSKQRPVCQAKLI